MQNHVWTKCMRKNIDKLYKQFIIMFTRKKRQSAKAKNHF